MKLYSKALPLACLAAIGLLFAVSTPAQRVKFPAKDYPKMAVPSEPAATSNLQDRLKSDTANPDATTTCSYTFTSGSAGTYLQFCVTKNGNIAEFESPLGVEQINQGGIGEGYGICDLTTDIAYYDYAFNASSNWSAPTTVTHTATMVKIERTTTDGAWTLTQTITSSAGTNPYAKVLMALKNNSGETKGAILLREADSDPGNAAQTDSDYAENGDGTADSAWSYISIYSSPAYGLMLQTIGNPTPASAPFLREGFAQNLPTGPNPCDAFANQTSPVTATDDSIVYYWQLQLNKEQTVSTTTRYISF